MALMGVENYDPYSGVGMVDALVNGDFTRQIMYMEDRGFVTQVAQMQAFDMSMADYVIIEFGTNDALKLVPTGTDGIDSDTRTTAGALYHMIETLKMYKPALGIVVCNVQPMTGYADAQRLKMYDSDAQNKAIQSVCKMLHVPMIDLCTLLGLNDFTKKLLLSDGLHRSYLGKLIQAQIIENQMCQLF